MHDIYDQPSNCIKNGEESMNPFAISGLLITATYFPLMFFVLSKGKTKAAKIYSLHLFTTGLWGVGSFIIGSNYFNSEIELIWKCSYVSVLFIPVLFFHTALEITKSRSVLLIFFYLQATIFSVLTVYGYVFDDFKIHFNSFYYFKGNSLYLISFLI